ncbi:MAG: glycosyltransferase family 9 protein [candidate division KSB1 bacterium]|nr:glycosyltransferase family 9 protein [candidate division KSB1 bacterium]
MRIPKCKLFTGYAPCQPYKNCLECRDEFPFDTNILIINLDNLGAVLMTTAQLPAIKRKYPKSLLSWLTRKNARPLLENNPYLDRVYEWNDENRLILTAMKFDVVMNADKNANSSALTRHLKADQKLGFGLNDYGATIPLNQGAYYNYRTGIDDVFKFKLNQKTGQEILAETFELDYQRDEYVLNLSEQEKAICEKYRTEYGLEDCSLVVGFNTGCSELFPLKKMTIDQHVTLIRRIAKELPDVKVLLLGGKEDTERNRQIKELVGDAAINTPTTMGLRAGICFVNLCDLVVSGDSLGMHIAIGLKKYVIAWFGLSCAQEVDLYDRGVKVVSQLPCSPCWRRTCDDPRCVKELDIEKIYQSIVEYYANLNHS